MGNQSNQQIEEISQEIEAIYNETIAKVKVLEQEEKKIISNFLKKKEQEKIEQIRNLLLI